MESKFWTRRRARHLLTGLVYCGVCGARFTSVGRDYLGRGGARNSGNCHNKRSIRRGQLESLILDALKSRLMWPDLVKEFVAEFHREINRLNRDSEQARESRVKEMKAVSRKLDGLIEAIADGLCTLGLKGRLMELEQRKQTLEEELAHAPAPAPAGPTFTGGFPAQAKNSDHLKFSITSVPIARIGRLAKISHCVTFFLQ
jgi:hypothetical protein